MDHFRKLVHTMEIPVRWGDMDAMGHVNNTVYFRYMESTRIEWLAELGFGAGLAHDEGPVIINAACTFLIPFVYPGTVVSSLFVGKPGRSSLPTFHEMRLQGSNTLYAEGTAKIVWMNYRTGKSIALPEYVRQLGETS